MILALCDFETTGLDRERDQPIEVALLFCEWPCLTIVGAYESLIWVDNFDESHFRALTIHKIIPQDLLDGGKPIDCVRKEVLQACKRYGRKRIVLCSDNAQFEHVFMRKLMAGGGADEGEEVGPDPWPFHYCVWDTSILLEGTGIGDPVPAHRAMADVGLLHQALIAAKHKIKDHWIEEARRSR